jgi:tetratricopeptide (TPR) repeat protein
MSTLNTSYLNDPLYKEVLRHFHLGEWNEGFAKIKQLVEIYPDSPELHELEDEMELRAHLDVDEAGDRKNAIRKQLTKWSIRLAVVLVLIGLVYWGTQTYSHWIQNQLSSASQSIDTEVQQIKLAMKFRDGQNLLVAGREDMAGMLFDEIAAVNPNYPGLQAELEKVNHIKTLDTKYSQAESLINQNELTAGLSLLNEIKAENPYFNDVATRIQDVENRIFMDDLLSKADRAYQAKDWEQAITNYETVRITDPSYQTDLVEQRLLSAYLNAATDALNSKDNDFKNLDVAETYFRKALALKPQDPLLEKEREQVRQKFSDKLASSYIQSAQETLKNQADSITALRTAEQYFQRALNVQKDDVKIQDQLQMVKVYLQAQQDFGQGLWNQVISGLEEVYLKDSDYALGTARQMLYEAYLARGQNSMTAGKYQLALEDFERAAILAQESSEPLLRVFYAQTKIASAQAALGNYQEAAQVMRNVFESLMTVDNELSKDASLKVLLDKADKYLVLKNYKMAYQTFNQAAPAALLHYASLIDYVIQPGDYLAQLANRYNTTIGAILQANHLSLLSVSKQLTPGDTLVIPKANP